MPVLPAVWAVYGSDHILPFILPDADGIDWFRKETRAMEYTAWEGFQPGEWQKSINVRDFIQKTIRRMRGMNRF